MTARASSRSSVPPSFAIPHSALEIGEVGQWSEVLRLKLNRLDVSLGRLGLPPFHRLVGFRQPEPGLCTCTIELDGALKLLRRAIVKTGREQLLFAPGRAPEELYDLAADPHETRNLAADHPEVLKEMRERLDRWMKETGDRGPESAAMYDSDMAVYLAETKDPARRKILEDNIALMKRWAAEGK